VTTPQPQDATPEEQPPKGHRNRWIWACAGLAVLVVGLLIWGLSRQSQLDDAQADVATLESQADQSKDTGSTVVTAFKGAYDDLAGQLGATNEDLDQTQQDLADAQKTAAQTEQDAAAAKEDAANAKDQTEKAKAEAEQANAETENAKSKLTIATDCAKAYVSAIGSLFEGDSVSAQAGAVKDRLEGISDDCASALGGA
jgi:uncharacterized protein YoxC